MAISVVTAIVLMFNIDIKTLGDMGRLTSDLPKFITPNVPFNFETLSIIFPYAISLSIVGIVESLLTAQLIDEITETPSQKIVKRLPKEWQILFQVSLVELLDVE